MYWFIIKSSFNIIGDFILFFFLYISRRIPYFPLKQHTFVLSKRLVRLLTIGRSMLNLFNVFVTIKLYKMIFIKADIVQYYFLSILTLFILIEFFETYVSQFDYFFIHILNIIKKL